MVGCECVIHQRVNYVLDCLQFLGSLITNELRDDQIFTVRTDFSSHQCCTFDDSTGNGLSCDSLTHNIPDPGCLELQIAQPPMAQITIARLSTAWSTTSSGSATGYLTASAKEP